MEPITGRTTTGIPFTALPPHNVSDAPAPLIVTWHMMDAPCSDAAFAAALPLAAVPAWRVHLGMPWRGARPLDGGDEAALARIHRDPVMEYMEPVVGQAVAEFPDALNELRERFPVDDGPIGLVGGSLGGAVALSVLAEARIPVRAAAVVNAAIRGRSVVGLIEAMTGRPYSWDVWSARVADRLDFVARAGDTASATPQPPLLVVSGALDEPAFRTDAAELATALGERYADPDHVRLTTIPDLAHPLADRPGDTPAPQLPTAKAVDDAMTAWFLRHLR